ncbi:trem-like transcript 1 protein isoform X2 [Pteronotus mesoamericanus]|uniref:trem-like transcript 1 protein isoform X2 n=1 Tax=Pteronotus mesoamericanus TaxID=1884717 RepID=UPI0023EAAA92|nr:trem-like transcript 1 protein isoform X2 [Pteronotus parnellii mesoamericanus]
MGPNLLLLLLLGLAGKGSAEELQAPAGGSLQVDCLYQLQDIRSRKVWCRFLPEGCQPLVSSAVDRRAPGHSRTFLTDLGSGLLRVEMIDLREEDAGEYGCMVEGASGPQTVRSVTLRILPTEEEEVGSLADDPSSDPAGSARPLEPRQDKSILLIWVSVLLLGLLVVAVVLFAVVARKKGNRLVICGQSQSRRGPGMVPSSTVHIDDSGLAVDVPSNIPYARLDSPPSFDNSTYTSLNLEPPSGKPPYPAPSSSPALTPKVLSCSKPVTYATVIFPGGDKSGGASWEPAQDPPKSQTPPS